MDHKPGDYPAQKWEYKVAKELLRLWIVAHCADAARIIEIGAGDGAFLRQIVPELVNPERVFCTEYDDYALRKIRQLGVRAAQGDIRQLDMSSEKAFSIVFMFQVLEHMDRLPELFSKFRTLTSSKADLVIAVPNDKRTQFNESNGALLDMPPNHIGRWTKSSFEALGAREGWEVIKFLEEPTNAKQSWQHFSHYRYARATQFDNSVSARVRGLRPTPLSRALELAIVAGFAVRSVPLLPRLFADGMGGSVLVHLRRQE
jgi:2-polyprenyl-3-methyl-5-hydroxy-6-metoxy-1,4-benzoquinol methylase